MAQTDKISGFGYTDNTVKQDQFIVVFGLWMEFVETGKTRIIEKYQVYPLGKHLYLDDKAV